MKKSTSILRIRKGNTYIQEKANFYIKKTAKVWKINRRFPKLRCNNSRYKLSYFFTIHSWKHSLQNLPI